MSKIELKIKNYKQYSEAEFEGEGPLLCFLGTNGAGKSSAMQAIEESLLAKNFVKEPIKKGETEANIFFKYVNKDGDPIQVITTIDGDNKYSLTAGYIKDGKVKNISDPKKIREIIGNYYPLTVESTLSMTAYAEGRRKFINEYLLPLLGDEKKARLSELQNAISDKKIKATEGNWYHTRTEKNRELTSIEGELKASVLSDEDKNTIASKDAVVKALNKLKEEKELHKNDEVKRNEFETSIDKLHEINNRISTDLNWLHNVFMIDIEKERISILTKLTEAETNIDSKQDGLYTSEQITALEEKITRGNNKITEIATLEKRTTNTDIKAKRDKIFSDVNDLNTKIEKAKEEIQLIYKNSSLPAGLQIDEETIILNGFELSETTNSNTEVRMAVIELLCRLNTSGFINIGDWTNYGNAAKKKILEFAKKNNLIFIGQQVTEDTKTILQTIILD
jgi:recombinational DNA repair ATPase RecF